MPSDKYQNLLEEKGGRGFPHLIFMDFEGNKIGDVGGRDVASFERSAAGLPAPKFDPVLAEKLTSNLAAAKSAMEAKQYGRAIEAIKVVLS
ncbi:MAG: hypothetical protein HY720_11415, partial [Planctomycetes bacterium]|nr:hypothetical protein [Planctomycetota bacterium]